jgi:hypothetical protein
MKYVHPATQTEEFTVMMRKNQTKAHLHQKLQQQIHHQFPHYQLLLQQLLKKNCGRKLAPWACTAASTLPSQSPVTFLAKSALRSKALPLHQSLRAALRV